ncbi:VanZ family protein [Clostridium lundense]|uniref:VanZ family protein n=1 Tax=Clostridium lundense TaxID=319475 RepID=UPI000485D84B|nr:VanZ family protein [Clostridium lundense]
MRKIISIILCLFWMGLIFYNSSNTGLESNKKSYQILNDIKIIYHKVEDKVKNNSTKVYENNINEEKKKVNNVVEKKITKSKNEDNKYSRNEKFNLFLRKNAHAFEYLILAMLLGNAFYSFRIKPEDAIIYILFICLFYAVTDEYHQLFVKGRTSSIQDVLIDFTGGVFGMVLYYKFRKMKLKRGKNYRYKIYK